MHVDVWKLARPRPCAGCAGSCQELYRGLSKRHETIRLKGTHELVTCPWWFALNNWLLSAYRKSDSVLDVGVPLFMDWCIHICIGERNEDCSFPRKAWESSNQVQSSHDASKSQNFFECHSEDPGLFHVLPLRWYRVIRNWDLGWCATHHWLSGKILDCNLFTLSIEMSRNRLQPMAWIC